MPTSALEAIAQCDPNEALSPTDPRRVNFDVVRGVAVQRNLQRIFDAEEAAALAGRPRRYGHIALAGHIGSGKSTELQKFQGEAEKAGYLVLLASVVKLNDENEITYSDVLRILTEELERKFRTDATLRPLSKERVKNVYQWFRDVTRIDEKEVETGMQLGGEAGLGGDAKAKVGLGGPATAEAEVGLGKLLAFIGLQRRSFTRRREEIRESLEKYPQALLDNLNLLLDDAQAIARACGHARGVLFILDDVDKYPDELVNKAFVRNSLLFDALNAHMVFTVKISLLLKPVEDNVESRFLTETLPALPVYKREPREPNAPVLDALVEAIYLRVPKVILPDEAMARDVARLSGGNPRDMLRILQRALIEADDVVSPANLRRAIGFVRAEMSRPLTMAHYDVMARAHLDGRIDPDEMGREMLLRRQVLEYNGERWVDAHPLLQDTPEFKSALERERKRRSGGPPQVA